MSENGSQFRLLRQRRFLPFFCTQFLGAFNDNVYKNALMILLAFHASALTTLDRKSTRLNSSHSQQSRMPSSA